MAKNPKNALKSAFDTWKNSKESKATKLDSSKMLGMVSCLQKLITRKSHRIFNPPTIIKDADEILRRMIRKMLRQGYLL